MPISLDGSNGIAGVDGTAAAPAITGADNNTGFVFGTDEATIVTGGTERVNVNASGDVDLGALTVSGSATDNIVNLDSGNRFFIGATTTPIFGTTVEGSAPRFSISGDGFVESLMGIFSHRDDTVNGGSFYFTRSRGTAASPTTVQDNDELGKIRFLGYEGTDFNAAGAEIASYVDGTPGANDMPGELRFATTRSGNSTVTDCGLFNSRGYFHASASTADTTRWSDNDTHLLHSAKGSSVALVIENSSDSAPSGVVIDFSDASPDNNTRKFLSCTDSTTERMRVWSDGDLDNHDNSYGSMSDQKLKQDIVDAGSQWDDIKNLRVRKWRFIDDVAAYGDEAKTLIGVVAQEVETVSPGLVKDNPDIDEDDNDLGTVTKSVRYSVLYMKAIKALQEAQARIETLETQHADLMARVAALEAA